MKSLFLTRYQLSISVKNNTRLVFKRRIDNQFGKARVNWNNICQQEYSLVPIYQCSWRRTMSEDFGFPFFIHLLHRF